MMGSLVDLVARVPARVQVKLLAAFLAIAMLLIIVGAVGLQVLRGVNERTEELIGLQRKIEAYRQVQHDTISQLYSVSSALLSSDEQTLSRTLRQLNQLGYDVDRLQFVAKDEIELLSRFRQDYDRFVEIVTRGIELMRAGRTAEAREIQAAVPLADRLERLTSQLVNKAEADAVAGIETGRQAYENSQWIVIAFAVASIILALARGYTISWSLIGPVKQIEAQLNHVAAGHFTQRVDVINRDELGALAPTSTKCRRNWVDCINNCVSAPTISPNPWSSKRRRRRFLRSSVAPPAILSWCSIPCWRRQSAFAKRHSETSTAGTDTRWN